MPDQTLEQDILDEAAYAQKYGGGMASLDFAVLDEWAERAAKIVGKLRVYKRAEQILRENRPFGPFCLRAALAEAREEIGEHKEGSVMKKALPYICPEHPDASVMQEYTMTHYVLNGYPAGAGVESGHRYYCNQCRRELSRLPKKIHKESDNEPASG